MTKASQPFSSWDPLHTRQLRGAYRINPSYTQVLKKKLFKKKNPSKAAKNPDFFELNRFLYHLFLPKCFLFISPKHEKTPVLYLFLFSS